MVLIFLRKVPHVAVVSTLISISTAALRLGSFMSMHVSRASVCVQICFKVVRREGVVGRLRFDANQELVFHLQCGTLRIFLEFIQDLHERNEVGERMLIST